MKWTDLVYPDGYDIVYRYTINHKGNEIEIPRWLASQIDAEIVGFNNTNGVGQVHLIYSPMASALLADYLGYRIPPAMIKTIEQYKARLIKSYGE